MSLKNNIDAVLRDFRGINRKVVDKAIVTALNKTGKEVSTEAKRKLSDATGLKKGTVAKRIKIEKARRNKETTTIKIGGRYLNLIEFGGRQTKAGVSHKAWGQRQVARGAFIFTGKNSGKRLVGKRVKGQKTGTGKARIKGLYGANIPTEFFRQDVDKIVKRKIKTRFPILFRTALDFQFRKTLKADRFVGRFVK